MFRPAFLNPNYHPTTHFFEEINSTTRNRQVFQEVAFSCRPLPLEQKCNKIAFL